MIIYELFLPVWKIFHINIPPSLPFRTVYEVSIIFYKFGFDTILYIFHLSLSLYLFNLVRSDFIKFYKLHPHVELLESQTMSVFQFISISYISVMMSTTSAIFYLAVCKYSKTYVDLCWHYYKHNALNIVGILLRYISNNVQKYKLAAVYSKWYHERFKSYLLMLKDWNHDSGWTPNMRSLCS